jgi:RNA polymerase sigma-70 factor, ECF subfamily
VDDRGLLERVKRGDEQAFAGLYARHQSAIYRYAMHMCGAAAADDIVQDTFLALLRGQARYDSSRGTVIGYLFGIARHHVAKRLAAAGVELSLDPIDEVDATTGPVAVETPLDVMSRAELVAHVREAIRSLPPVYREAIVLCELQEVDYATAAAIVQCPIGTIRSRLHRAKAMLTTKLATSYSAPLIEPAKRSAR